MNAKEMQAAIEGLQLKLTAIEQAVTELRAVEKVAAEVIQRQGAMCDALREAFGVVMEGHTASGKRHEELVDAITGLEAHRASSDALLEDLSAKVNGRNKSAATKRNMTEADALTVMTGELKDLSHKDAAERIGLTYAQVYSARGEFTFKDVHKTLREGGWINPWAKK